MLNIHFFKLASLFYLLRTLFYSVYILLLKDSLSKLSTIIVINGFVSHTLALVARYLETGYTPVTNLHESFSFFAWMIIGILLIANIGTLVTEISAVKTTSAMLNLPGIPH